MSEESLKDLNETLDARNAKRVSFTTQAAPYVEKITRSFWVNHDKYQESQAHLKSFTDASNCDPTNPVETEYIIKPSIGRSSDFAGKWVHSEVVWVQESSLLLQTLTKVYDITTNQNLWDRPAIPTYDNEILNTLGLSTTETDGIAFVISALTKESRAYCLDTITDEELVTQLAGSGYSYQGRRFEVNQQDNTGVFTVTFKKASSSAFVATSPDIEWKINKDTKQERFNQIWSKVNNTDALTGLYTPTAGYNVTSVIIAEGDSGSLRIQRTQLLEARGTSDSAYDESSIQVINPHSLVPGAKYSVIVKNEHIRDKLSPYGTINSSHTGYTLIDTTDREEGNGLYTVNYYYEKTVWSAWDHTYNLQQYSNVGKLSETRNRIWYGIQLSDKATAEAECLAGTGQAILPSGYIVSSVAIRDNGNGSLTVTQQIRKPNGTTPIGRERYDQEGVYLKERKEVTMLSYVPGGLSENKRVKKSVYGQLFEGNAGTADELAWTFSNASGTPSPYTATAESGILDPATGIEISGASEGYVAYRGNGVWEGIRIVYEGL